MSSSKDIFDLEKQNHQLVDHPIHLHPQQQSQQPQQQQLPLHAHLEPEDVRVSPFQMDVNMNPSLNAVLQPTTPPPNPGPFGLCAFALTAFCMGLYNLRAGVDAAAPGNFITGTAMFYGGLGQVKCTSNCFPFFFFISPFSSRSLPLLQNGGKAKFRRIGRERERETICANLPLSAY
jgi:hypothetical protein